MSLCLFVGGEGRDGRKGELKCYRHTDIQTYRPSDEAGPRGAFAPKNVIGKVSPDDRYETDNLRIVTFMNRSTATLCIFAV